ncbi:Panacea domain-containing protein [Polaribacter sp. IC063]|uniref:Panacea domain-containing protein n=1 Tax=Polaribacter sp. IC063 TaxID=57031 RepID=UPI0011BEA116|nr:type II toxin-antitoxin system antitoxin SocA domain-containing protein [Polaribacter sp. IC063]TXD48137.1 DUF4065 domain-containing protein [Polaribacter sp. IC063]
MKSLNNFSAINVSTLAGYLLKYFGPMSHLKLQKLLFYCQAYHLATFDESLFEEDFEAWVHGPVCRSVFDTLKGKSVLHSDVTYSEYDFDADKDFKDLVSSSQFELVNDVLNSLSGWSGAQLEKATHDEAPWNIARDGLSPNKACTNIISKDSMLSFYKNEMSKWDDN